MAGREKGCNKTTPMVDVYPETDPEPPAWDMPESQVGAPLPPAVLLASVATLHVRCGAGLSVQWQVPAQMWVASPGADVSGSSRRRCEWQLPGPMRQPLMHRSLARAQRHATGLAAYNERTCSCPLAAAHVGSRKGPVRVRVDDSVAACLSQSVAFLARACLQHPPTPDGPVGIPMPMPPPMHMMHMLAAFPRAPIAPPLPPGPPPPRPACTTPAPPHRALQHTCTRPFRTDKRSSHTTA